MAEPCINVYGRVWLYMNCNDTQFTNSKKGQNTLFVADRFYGCLPVAELRLLYLLDQMKQIIAQIVNNDRRKFEKDSWINFGVLLVPF